MKLNTSKILSASNQQFSNSTELAKIVDRLTRRILDGESIDAETLAREYSEFADELQELLPAITAVATLSSGDSYSSTVCANEDPASRVLGDFHIVREIGRGGMGIVYEAEQISLGRRVAVKVLPYTGMLSDTQLQRFKNEAKAAASLHHANIVNAFFVGQERGVHFYAMRLIEGRTLAEIIAACNTSDSAKDRTSNVDDQSEAPTAETKPVAELSTQRESDRSEFHRTVARLGMQAADALACAHSMGIVHRDIKPSNLMIDHDAHLWVTDFGLASTNAETNLTLTGDLLGTLRYMSPEQASGEANADARTDIYSLGVTLYELLTLRPALDGESRVELLKQLEEREPAGPRSIDGTIPRDIENIILKAIAKSPSMRYGSASDLKDDLLCFLAHRPVKARRITKTQLAVRWAQRRPMLAALLATVLGLLSILAVGGPWMAISQQRVNHDLLKLHYGQAVALAYENWKLQPRLDLVVTHNMAKSALG